MGRVPVLPGGRSVLWGWWWLVWRSLPGRILPFAIVVAGVWLVVGGEVGLVAAGVVALGWVVVAWCRPIGVRVTDQRFPELSSLVQQTARRCGLPVADRIWLGSDAEVIGQVRAGRRELIIGLPAV
ncbi:MAG: hypothetical protein JXA67_11860 [Micromonosporaceae bacterium]|nr:hypothetical protein [Micromonosporaceae bacterium]